METVHFLFSFTFSSRRINAIRIPSTVKDFKQIISPVFIRWSIVYGIFVSLPTKARQKNNPKPSTHQLHLHLTMGPYISPKGAVYTISLHFHICRLKKIQYTFHVRAKENCISIVFKWEMTVRPIWIAND